MSRIGPLMLAAFAFAGGFTLLFAAEFLLSSVSRSIWLVPGLILLVTLLMGVLPSYRLIERRVVPFFVYGSAFAACYIYSTERPIVGSSAERIAALTIPLIFLAFGFSVIFYIRSIPGRPAIGWLTLAMAMGLLVAYFSGRSGGTGGGAWERWLADHLGLSLHTAEVMVIVVRKTVHFTFYGLLALVAWRAALKDRTPLGEAFLFAVLFSFVHAGFDEFRQSMTPERTGQIMDIGIDLLGAIVFVKMAARKSRGIRPEMPKP